MKNLLLIILLLVANNAFSKTKVVTIERPPWETNSPYLDDEYSKKYALQNDKSQSSKDAKKSECTKKGMTFKERVDCLNALSTDTKNPLPERGTKEYFMEFYAPKAKALRSNSVALKAQLKELSDLRKKTRMITAIGKAEYGELTFEQVNSEICLIEKHIGFLSTQKYCIR